MWVTGEAHLRHTHDETATGEAMGCADSVA